MMGQSVAVPWCFVVPLHSASVIDALSGSASSPLIQPHHIDAIAHGGVAVLDGWLSPDLINRMRNDAKQLFAQGYFTPDGLTNTALKKEEQGFTSKADRQTFRGGDGWDDANAGDVQTRHEFSSQMRQLRRELAIGLNRPSLDPEGVRKHEMTYNWYEPGAQLGRHLDEHHEETKGAKGWQAPTRRSVTWLVYLNDDWDAEEEGGALHTFPRREKSSVSVGSHEGNLQVGWIDHVEPVFLDAWRPSGQTALYRLAVASDLAREYISQADFDVPRQPIEFERFLVLQYQRRFEQISSARLDPRFVEASSSANAVKSYRHYDDEVHSYDVAPLAGRLVLFDSVTLPHSVNSVTASRQRIAATGWFHEDNHKLPTLGEI